MQHLKLHQAHSYVRGGGGGVGKKTPEHFFVTRPKSRAARVISNPCQLIGMLQIHSVSSKLGLHMHDN